MSTIQSFSRKLAAEIECNLFLRLKIWHRQLCYVVRLADVLSRVGSSFSAFCFCYMVPFNRVSFYFLRFVFTAKVNYVLAQYHGTDFFVIMAHMMFLDFTAKLSNSFQLLNTYFWTVGICFFTTNSGGKVDNKRLVQLPRTWLLLWGFENHLQAFLRPN